MGEYGETTFELLYDLPEEERPEPPKGAFLAPDEALVDCINRCGRPDPEYLAALTGKSPQALLFHDLRGAVFQDPEQLAPDQPWSPEKGWVLRDQYLWGNVMAKLEAAKKAEARHPGLFRENVEALRKTLPDSPGADEIHASLGATWLPESFYEDFVKELLQLPMRPRIHYSHSLSKWTLRTEDRAKDTVLSRYTYGTADLSAYEILVQTMNAKTVKVYDRYEHYNGKEERILNQARTLAAQEKQKLILRRFEEWVHESFFRREAVQEYYCRAYAGYVGPGFDGSFLRFPDMNGEIRLYERQRNAVARILLSGRNVLLAHPVGAGKTYVMIAAAHELKRMGLSSRTMIVVPNNILRSTVDLHRQLYPKDRFLAIYPKDFTPAKRAEALRQIREEDGVCIYMAYSSFDMIVMSKDYWIAKRQQEIRDLERAAVNSLDKGEKQSLETEAARRKKQLSKFVVEAEDCPWPSFDSLGIHTLFVDEAHNYKNIEISSRTDNIVGMHGKGSKKCIEMLEKCRCVKRLIFATGTPLTNSLADLFVMQTFLQPEELRYRSIDSFDMWINTFGERETNYEVDVDGKSLRPMTRFSSFHNLTELMHLFSGVCDFAEGEADTCLLPRFGGYTNVLVPRSRVQADYMRFLSRLTEQIRAHKVKRTEYNLLSITALGRAVALDPRLVDTDAAGICSSPRDTAKGKISVCADKIRTIYEQYPGTCQIVFSDLGTPKAGFNVYDELKRELIGRGVGSKEIAFVHDADSENARAALFRNVNSGAIRVIIGSTPKLGTGVNVQERLIAMHQLHAPWRPSDLKQQEGRILRFGNKCEEIFAFRYITEASFDSYIWQIQESKQRFISSFLSGTAAARDREDIADAVLSCAEIKALAIGNPLVKKRVETANLLDRRRMAYRQRQKQLSELHALLEDLPRRQQGLLRQRAMILRDAALYAKEKAPVPLEDRRALGEELQAALADNVLQPRERLFDRYQGFDIILPAAMTEEHPYVYLRGGSGCSYYLDMDCDKLLGFAMRIDYLLEHLPGRAEALDRQIQTDIQQARDARDDILRGNPHADEIGRLERELERLDLALDNLMEEGA